MRVGDLDVGKRTLIMGIVNVTPDSFSDGGLHSSTDAAVAHAKQLVEEGADIIDIGGESTRPGSDPVPEEEELKRVLPVVRRLAEEVSAPISIDTMKPGVADACLSAGASILNDVTGLQQEEMRQIAGKHKCPVILMHMQGAPKAMQDEPAYDDVVHDISVFFEKQLALANDAGISKIILDPGIGFGKTIEHNLQILNRFKEFQSLGCPLLIGTSRKSFIGTLTDLPVSERIEGTLASTVAAVLKGASIVRVHDVKEVKRALLIADAIQHA